MQFLKIQSLKVFRMESGGVVENFLAINRLEKKVPSDDFCSSYISDVSASFSIEGTVKGTDKNNTFQRNPCFSAECTHDTTNTQSPEGNQIKSDQNLKKCDSESEPSLCETATFYKNEISGTSEQLVCPHCSKVIKNNGTFLKHKEYCLRKITWTKKCTYCDKMFRDNYGLKRHLKVHGIYLTSKRYECSYCKKNFRDNYNMSKHIDAVHKIEKVEECHYDSKLHFQCDRCQTYFKDKTSLRRHTKMEHVCSGYKCHICKKKFTDVNKLNTHIMHRHQSLCYPETSESNCFCKNAFPQKSKEQNKQSCIALNDTMCSKCDGCFADCKKCNKSKPGNLFCCCQCEVVVEDKSAPEKHLLQDRKYDLGLVKSNAVPYHTKSSAQKSSDQLTNNMEVCVCCYHRLSTVFSLQHTLSVYSSCSECGISLQSEHDIAFHLWTDHGKLMDKLCDIHYLKINEMKCQKMNKSKVCQTADRGEYFKISTPYVICVP